MRRPRPKILFVSDAVVFGGHERVCVDLSRALVSSFEVCVAAPRENGHFLEELRATLPDDAVFELRQSFRRGGVYFGRLQYAHRAELRRLLQVTEPDHVVLAQGRIEASIPLMHQLRSMAIPFTSLLPFAHRVGEIKGPGITRKLEDAARSFLYALPAEYIVPTSSAARQLGRRGVRAPIHVVPNLVDLRQRRVSASASPVLVRCIGRIEFRQKQQDKLVRLLAQAPARFSDFRFEFVGDGPDLEELKHEVRARNLSGLVTVTQQLPRAAVLAGVGIVLMPSRFEGLPLVMLEALSSAIPVIGSNIDVFQEYLPETAICTFATPDDLFACLHAVTADENRKVWLDLAERVKSIHGPEAYLASVQNLLNVWPAEPRG